MYLLIFCIFQISLNKRREQNESLLYELEGLECLGSCLCILPRTETAPNLANCSIQWYRVQPEESKKELISGMHYFGFVHINENKQC